MTDRPVIFSAPMVRTLLDGRKTMTRRLAYLAARVAIQVGDGPLEMIMVPSPWQRVQPSDRLWVREAFNVFGGGDPGTAIYAANWRKDAQARGLDNIPATTPKWRSPIHMPRWASRITLVVTATKIERLQEITDQEALAEGVEEVPAADPPLHRIKRYRVYGKGGEDLACPYGARISFSTLWDSIHGEGAWDLNPAVVAISFAVRSGNIDGTEPAKGPGLRSPEGEAG